MPEINKATGCRKERKMEDTVKLRAFIEEFPWIEKIIKEAETRPEVHIRDAYVKRVDLKLLEEHPDVYFGFYYFLVNKDGEVLCEVGKTQKRVFFFWTKEFIDESKNVGSALTDIPELAEKVEYVVSAHKMYIKLCKLPKTFNLLEWTRSQQCRMRVEYRLQADTGTDAGLN